MASEARSLKVCLGKIRRRLEIVMKGPGRVRVVVLGHQKSGTTAIGALLATATDSENANDPLYSVDWGKADVAERLISGSTSLSDVVEANRLLFCSEVVKDPDLSFIISDCARTFPKARFVNVVRDPRQVVRSIADRLKLSSDDLRRSDVGPADMSRHWRLILEGRLPEIEGDTVLERLAFRWKRAWLTYSSYEGACELVRYEDFRAGKAPTIYGIATKLDMEVRTGIEKQVDVQFQPRGRRSIPVSDRLGSDNVRVVESICRDEMRTLGYEAGVSV